MTTTNNILAQKLARLDTVLSQMRALQDEYMPLKYESQELEEEIEKLEEEEIEKLEAEDDKRFDEIIDSLHNQSLKDAGIEIVEVEQYDEELSTKPWSHADDEVDNDR